MRKATLNQVELSAIDNDNDSVATAATAVLWRSASSKAKPKNDSDYNTNDCAFSGFQFQQNNKFAGLSNVMILNTGSSIPTTFMNPNIVHNIKTTNHPLMMSTNAGTKTMNLWGKVKGFGHIWFDPNQNAHIFGFSNLADNHHITYNWAIEDAFNVHINNCIIKFERTRDGLYAYRPPATFIAANVAKKYDATTNDQSLCY